MGSLCCRLSSALSEYAASAAAWSSRASDDAPVHACEQLSNCGPAKIVKSNPHPYEHLTPDVIIAAVESLGLMCDRRILGLNSYENRVYQVGIEAGPPLIAKFYRPERWTDAAILE